MNGRDSKAPSRYTGGVRGVIEVVITVAVAVVIALLVQAFLVKPYKIPSGSMMPTLQVGQRILVNRLDTHPGLGDIVVFHPPIGATGEGTCGTAKQGPGRAQPCDTDLPQESTATFVKRVVGLPGDRLQIIDGYVYRNGRRETYGYHPQADASVGGFIACVNPSVVCTFSKAITVPKGDYYMMGDNRGNSLDSRFWGPVPQRWIIGVAFASYWPVDRIGIF